MTHKVRFGILSFAHPHAEPWTESIADSLQADLVGIWDDDHARGRDAANKHGTRFWSDLESLLQTCDAVGITSETVNHPHLVEAAAHAGVHVLCEKPMATTLEGCDRIQRAVADSGVRYMQSFPKRFDPASQEIANLVDRGELGKISLVRVRHSHFHGLDQEFTRGWIADPVLGGGGALLDEGIHAADFLRWLLGDPESVQAVVSGQVLGLPVDDTAVAVFTYRSGTLAEIVSSWSMLAAESSVEIYGTNGTAILSGVDVASRDFAHPPYMRLFINGSLRGHWTASPTTPSFVSREFHHEVAKRFVDCLTTGEEPPTGLVEGRAALAMVLSAYEAARTSTAQYIDRPRRAP